MMRIKNAKFVTSVGTGGTFIPNDVPHIAMVGKSNVGKSSFINAVCNHNKLARISQSPGKTRLINYYSINNGQFLIVDLPGYGFAKAPKTEIEKWELLINDYMLSGYINHIFLLLDCRHEPTKEDKQMFDWINYYCIPYTTIVTKVDKLPKYKQKQSGMDASKAIGAISPAIPFSALKKQGLDEIWERLSQIVEDTALTQQ